MTGMMRRLALPKLMHDTEGKLPAGAPPLRWKKVCFTLGRPLDIWPRQFGDCAALRCELSESISITQCHPPGAWSPNEGMIILHNMQGNAAKQIVSLSFSISINHQSSYHCRTILRRLPLQVGWEPNPWSFLWLGHAEVSPDADLLNTHEIQNMFDSESLKPFNSQHFNIDNTTRHWEKVVGFNLDSRYQIRASLRTRINDRSFAPWALSIILHQQRPITGDHATGMKDQLAPKHTTMTPFKQDSQALHTGPRALRRAKEHSAFPSNHPSYRSATNTEHIDFQSCLNLSNIPMHAKSSTSSTTTPSPLTAPFLQLRL